MKNIRLDYVNLACCLLCLSLKDRRLTADVVFFYKVINDHIRLTFDYRIHVLRDVNRECILRSLDTPNLVTWYLRTNLFKYSFMNRIVGQGNHSAPS